MTFTFINQVVDARDKLPVSPKPPLLVKIAPDLTDDEKKAIAAVVTRPKVNIPQDFKVCFS